MNEWEKARGHPCDSQEWFFKMLGAPEYKFAWENKPKGEEMSKAPEICLYCDEGTSKAGGACGFCVGGKPLDTQEDWDNSWGKVGEAVDRFMKREIEADDDIAAGRVARFETVEDFLADLDKE